MKNFNIIKKRKDILQAKKYPKRVYNTYFTISYDTVPYPVLLVISTKKNCRTSVKRNLLKRRIKEIFFQYNKQHKFPYGLVVYNKTPAFYSTFASVEQSFLSLIGRISKET